MKLIQARQQTADCALSFQEIHLIHAALNEVVNGIHIDEFDVRVGHSRTEAARLMKDLEEIYDGGSSSNAKER
jgi:hypothetical protein